MAAPLYLKCTVNSQCVCPQTALTFRCPCKYNAPTKYVIILEVGLFIAQSVVLETAHNWIITILLGYFRCSGRLFSLLPK